MALINDELTIMHGLAKERPIIDYTENLFLKKRTRRKEITNSILYWIYKDNYIIIPRKFRKISTFMWHIFAILYIFLPLNKWKIHFNKILINK